jgi:hypothetical protein
MRHRFPLGPWRLVIDPGWWSWRWSPGSWWIGLECWTYETAGHDIGVAVALAPCPTLQLRGCVVLKNALRGTRDAGDPPRSGYRAPRAPVVRVSLPLPATGT